MTQSSPCIGFPGASLLQQILSVPLVRQDSSQTSAAAIQKQLPGTRTQASGVPPGTCVCIGIWGGSINTGMGRTPCLIQKVEGGAQEHAFLTSDGTLELQAARLHSENHKPKRFSDLNNKQPQTAPSSKPVSDV